MHARLVDRSFAKTFAALIGAMLVHALFVGTAFAQQDTEKRVQTMNKHAMSDYDSLEFELARKTLTEAISLIRQAGLDEAPIAARTYQNLAIVYVSGFKDRSRGLQQFVAALKINPALKLDPAVATPELEEVFLAAKKQVGNAAPVAPKEPVTPKEPEDKTPPDDIKGLQHTPVDEARPGEPLLIKAQLASDSGAVRVYLLYRVSGQADYTPVAMKSDGSGEWSAVIPGDEIEDRPVQYYLEARDRKGRAIIGSGSAPNPYIVTLVETAPGARIVHRQPVEKKREEDKDHFHRLFVFIMPGVGLGYHPAGNVTEVAWQKVATPGGGSMYSRASVQSPGGFAIAPFHLSVEVGGMITRHFSLSILGRFQVVTGANAETLPETENGNSPMGGTTKANGAVAGMIRARYRFLDGKWHPYIHVDIGGGEIRHALDLSSAGTAQSPLVDEATATVANNGMTPDKQLVCQPGASCFDSLRLGLLFIGGGAGVWYDVWKYVGIMLDVNVLGGIGVGGGQSGMNIDFQLGVGAHFL